MEQIAKLNYLRMPPRKVRAVAELLKGLSVNEAEAQLLAQRRRAAAPLLKLLRSATASAKHNQRIEPEKLYVESIRVDQGPMLERSLPRARGMATPIQKKMSHVTLVLGESEHTASPRFKIVISKKAKLPPEERKARRKEKTERDKRTTPETKKPGFFKRIFSRKTGTA